MSINILKGVVILQVTSNIKWKSLLINIAIPVSVGIISAIITGGGFDTYSQIVQPPLSPPPILFPIVWSILYILMGISSYLIVQQTEDIRTNKSLIVYAIQLAVNFFWPVFFFGLKAYLFSFIWIILLIAAIITMTVLYYRQNKIAAYLQIPYILWTIFAAYLNLGVYILN